MASANFFPTNTSLNADVNTTSITSRPKRARDQLSCSLCRQGKLKCNRAHPACDQCLKRTRGNVCTYVSPIPKAIKKPSGNVRGRIRHLEGLVVSLMNGGRVDADPPAGESAQSKEEARAGTDGSSDGLSIPQQESALVGQMSGNGGEISYVGATHWAAILNEITEVKRYFDDDASRRHGGAHEHNDDTTDFQYDATDNSTMLHNIDVAMEAPARMTKQELLNAIPPKKVVDRLVSQWFNSMDPFLNILHAPTFQDEYKRFWRNPIATPTMWLGLLYGILCVSTFYASRVTEDDSPSTMMQVDKYRNLACSAIVLADYTRPQSYVLECLLLCSESDYLRTDKAYIKVWARIGMFMRLALRMGYHRDPSHYPNITPFHGEMRRRVWAAIDQIDVLVSFQLGLPSMIRGIQSDTGPPHNFMDGDFSVNSTELPPSRPIDEMTPVSYPIAKSRICYVFAAAAEVSHAMVPPAFAEIAALDSRLAEAHSLIPSALRMRSMDQSVTDPPSLIMSRSNIEFLYQKTRCVLHRRYLVQAHTDNRWADSRKACIDAAMTILRHHSMLHNASQPGGQLHKVKWYMSSLQSHDIILAAMIICLEVSLNNKKGTELIENEMRGEQQDLIAALESSYQIWFESKSHPAEATQALGVMLLKIKEGRAHNSESETPGLTATEPNYGSSSQNYSATMSIDFESQEPQVLAVSQPVVSPQIVESTNLNDFSTIGDMLDMPLNLDWVTWDNQISGQKDLVPDQWFTNADLESIMLSEATNGIEDYNII